MQTYQIIHDETRAIAHWLDADGKATGEAAVFLSPRGALVTHILLDGDEAAKARALLSIASRLAPPVATLAAARRLESLGAIEPFPSWDELRAAITEGASGPEIQPLLSAAGDARSRAGLLLAEGRPLESLNATAEAEAALLDAYYRSRRPTDGEFRGLWRHQAAPLPGHDWEETVARLARHGFTAFFPNFLWGGVAFHPSEVLPVAALDAADDPLAACLEACRRHGIELHVWKVNFNLGRATPAAFARELRAAGRTQVLFDGSPREDWLCPTHPENRDLEIRSMVEVAERYAIDGVHFDYIRYPGREACFCPGCRSRFEARIGRALGDWPQAVRDDPELVASWGDFRREAITAVVRGVSERLRYSRPEVKISAAVFRHWPSDREVLGQDWGHWLEQGYLDFVTPMNYERSVAGFEAMTRRQLGWSAGRPLYPGIGFSVWDTGTALPVIAQIEAARRLGTGGYMIFEYDSAAAADLLPALGAGITAPGER
ncbi:MAG: hypothetical protein EA425_07340 [Puniceicoccaceae bacterium]|nr:MAG: hypothetical protein EA425_07340 [Puniceicoccaceae bacterium]